MPIFLDETIYLRWLNTIAATGNWLLPLQEFGWEPLSIWISAAINYFVGDSLLSLRLTSILTGIASLILLCKLAKAVKLPKLTLLPWLISPIILLHHYLGLRGDNLINLLFIWLLLLLYNRLVKKQPKSAYGLGVIVALGLLTKTTAIVFPIIIAAAYLYFRPKLKRSDFVAGLITILPVAFYYLSGTLNMVIAKKDVFATSSSVALFRDNLIQSLIWFWQYLTWPVVLLVFLGIYALSKTKKPLLALISISFLANLLFMLVTAKIFFPRYLLISFICLLVMAGFGLTWLISNLPRVLRPLVVVLLLPTVIFSFRLFTNITKAPLPEIEKWQYVTGWPSGYGLNELGEYLQQNPPQILVVENNDLVKSGLPYYYPQHQYSIVSLDDAGQLPEPLPASTSAFMVLNIFTGLPEGFAGEQIAIFPRPENQSSIRLYRLNHE